MCLDIGHWHFAGMGSEFNNMGDWIEMCSKRLGHMHLHDNDGSSDQHLSLGRGGIDFRGLWGLLRKYSLEPSFTIENQTAEELEASAGFLKGCSL
jgi:sugar phosphate isomerase/epimerase